MELQETYGDFKPGPATVASRRLDYSVFASSELKRMLKHLSEQLTDRPAARAAPILDQIEMIAVTLRAKLREAPAVRREQAVIPAQAPGEQSSQ